MKYWHFFYSQAQMRVSQELNEISASYGHSIPNRVRLDGKWLPYTEILTRSKRNKPKPPNNWGDNIYLGCLTEKQAWKNIEIN